MKNNRTNPQHLNDAEQDICECDDLHCSHCFGTCQEPAVVTMYDTTRDETTQTGRRMCAHCADNLFDTSNMQWQVDFGRNPDEEGPYMDEINK